MIAGELSTNDDADVLCMESNYLQLSDARKLLHRYLDNGRGVFLIVNRVTPAINGYLRELGFEPESAGESAPAGQERLKYIAGNHPIFHPFVSADYGNLMDVKSFQIRAAQSAGCRAAGVFGIGRAVVF